MITGVWLSDSFDLEAFYGPALRRAGPDIRVLQPQDVAHPEDIRFALCWEPAQDAFARYPNLTLAMSVGAGVDALIAHCGVTPDMQIARIRDPHQADLMAGFVAHEVLHHQRGFHALMHAAAAHEWMPVSMRAPKSIIIAVLGHGTMGRAVTCALSALGFSVRVACRKPPENQIAGVTYCTGPDAAMQAAAGADYLVNVLPLTPETENTLNADLFRCLKSGAWLIQIGRGEHLVEDDLLAALDNGQLSGATLDVFRHEPLPRDHRFWSDPRLRITPHIASMSQTEVVAEQVVETIRALRDDAPMQFCIDRAKGY
jgi:glyoxylate/hydroxypyruvate reductase A